MSNVTETEHEDSSPQIAFDNIKLLAIAPKIPALISIVCSYVIIREVVAELRCQTSNSTSVNNRSRQRSASKSLLRCFLLISVADIVFTTPWFVTTWASPSDLDYLYGNVGTVGTCTAQGFFLQLGNMAAPLMILTLAVFSLLMVRYRWTDTQVAKLEPWFYSVIWTVSLACAILPLPFDMYNNFIQVCWIVASPLGCQETWSYGQEAANCARGDNAGILGLVFTVVRWPIMFACIVIMVLMYCSVRSVEDRMAQYAGSLSIRDGVGAGAGRRRSTRGRSSIVSSDQGSEDMFGIGSSDALRSDTQHPARPAQVVDRTVRREHSRALAIQASLIILSFLLTYILDTISVNLYLFRGAYYPALDFFAYAVLLPLEGLYTFLIFARPRHKSMVTPEGRILRWLLFGSCSAMARWRWGSIVSSEPGQASGAGTSGEGQVMVDTDEGKDQSAAQERCEDQKECAFRNVGDGASYLS